MSEANKTLTEFDNKNKVIVAIDESGTTNISKVDDQEKFILSAVILDFHSFFEAKKNIVSLKNKYWNSGLWENRRVILHGRDIQKKYPPFNNKYINYEMFINDLSIFLTKTNYKLISVVIDKTRLVNRYKYPNEIYSYTIELMMERIVFELNSINKEGIIVLESRGKKEDVFIYETISRIKNEGNVFNTPDFFKNISEVYFNPKHTDSKKKSYWVLELADINAYELNRYLNGRTNMFYKEIVEKKFRGYPNHKDGYGLKIFP